ncbi:hypothetical protein GM921_09575 [Pedobacter sp. LMG 31464]|uniref:UPF0758 domain-containing protein n=1 Tax=Pedobacter planticolens TaxID=2679964 RepID=A0A923DZ08_9SPHI|nr:UPF0758 domain-containing protein [Pedobacter planticolens]MBB2145735.1 hypothetical protein [Pedobacter planticolens]
MKSNIMYSEEFPSGPMRHYFFDYKQGPLGHRFMQITCSEKQPDGTYARNRVVFFERDLPMVVQALSSLCHHAGHLKFFVPKEAPFEVKREKGIPSWEPDMRPRKRMLAHGPSALSDAELVAILIGSGTPKETAVALAARMLHAFGGLKGLAGASYKRLGRFTGMGLAKCSAILSAIEIAVRLFSDTAKLKLLPPPSDP